MPLQLVLTRGQVGVTLIQEGQKEMVDVFDWQEGLAELPKGQMEFLCLQCDRKTTAWTLMKSHLDGKPHKRFAINNHPNWLQTLEKNSRHIEIKVDGQSISIQKYYQDLKQHLSHAIEFVCQLCHCQCTALSHLQWHCQGQKHRENVQWYATEQRGQKRPKQVIRPNRMKWMKSELRKENQTLEEHLDDMDNFPFLGLEFIEEVRSNLQPHLKPLYICHLEGCNGVWGDVESIKGHLSGNKIKHLRNYLAFVLKEEVSWKLEKNQVLKLAMEHNIEMGQIEGGRKYDLIRKTKDDERYQRICSAFDGNSKVIGNNESVNIMNQELAEKAIESFNNLYFKMEENLELIKEGQRNLCWVIQNAYEQFNLSIKLFANQENSKLVVKEFQDICQSQKYLKKEMEKLNMLDSLEKDQ